MERWDDLRLFLEVARQGSIAQAADRLGVHQTTVSRHIKALEAAAESQLFDRAHGGYILSSSGERLFAVCAQIEALVFEAQGVLGGPQAPFAGVVRFATEAPLMPLLSDHLGGFCRQHPGVEVELLLDEREPRVAYKQADLALRLGRDPSAYSAVELETQRLSGLGFALYASGAYLARHLGDGSPTAPLAQGSLKGHELIVGYEGLSGLASERWLRHLSDGARVALRSNSLTGHLEAARQGLGIVALPCFMVSDAPELVRLSATQLDPQSALWLVLPADPRHMTVNRASRALAEFLTQALCRRQAELEGR